MKILFVTDNFPPEVNAPASRTYEHCLEWVAQGIEVTVITCAPNFPRGKVYEGYRNRFYSSEVKDGIKIIRVWSYIVANAGFLKRILDYVSFAFMAFWAGLFQKTDVIIATSPQFFTTFTGFFLSILKRKPWIFELRDLWPESIVTVGAMEKGFAISTLEKLEQSMYRKADLIIPVTDAFKKRLIEYGQDESKIHVIPNGVNSKQFYPIPKDFELFEKHKLTGKTVIGYVGTHGMAHSLDFVVRTASKIDDTDIHFLFIGDGAQKNTVVALAAELAITNVTFLDSIPKASVQRYLSIMDAVLVPLRKSDTFKTVIPSKIFEAAAMQKPIVLGVDGQAREMVETYNAGIYFEPENEESFIKAIYRLQSDEQLDEQLRKGGQNLAKAFDRKALANRMIEIVVNLHVTKCVAQNKK
ncbi:glycosyltransferase family 4 protein [Kordiimonas aquimaris]|uniref:glycosyltransferase family 4 protein n=1 Tax=Kordiimonas aquimaris TaxID=707591 RepID=UPI0021D3A30C|nr:glycosyltransferase family 4 protein [Kordiimonas aquimaris]